MQYVQDLAKHVGEKVHLKGWVSNKRSGKGIYFIILRDGSGYIQCIASADQVEEAVMVKAEHYIKLLCINNLSKQLIF